MIKRIILLAAAFSLIYASNFQLKEMHKIRAKEKLVPFKLDVGDSPEIVIANKMMGGFKGVIILLLWLRAINLEEDGKYFELIQLFDLIGKLENRIGSVWTYAAWNMSYNIAKEMPYTKSKWKWIKAGIGLIKDKGLIYCARDSKLYEQLAWLYYNKIGGISDTNSPLYREYFAKEMHYIFGESPEFNEMLAVEKKLENILINETAKEIYQIYFSNENDRNIYFKIIATELDPDEKFIRFEEKFGESPELKKLVLYYRRKMIQDYRISIPIILKMEKTYGQLDWRSSYSHGLYWTIYSKEEIYNDHISLDRMEMYNLKTMYDYGYIYQFTNKDGTISFHFGPDLDRAKMVHQRYIFFMNKYPKNMKSQTFYSAHHFFIQNVVSELLVRGDREQAEEFFNAGKPYFNMESTPEKFNDYVLKTWKISLKDQKLEERIAFVYASITRYYIDKFVHQKYKSKQNKLQKFIIKNYKKFKEKEKEGQYKLQETLEETIIFALQRYLRNVNEEQLNKKYIKRFEEEIKRLEKIVLDRQK
ncbi:MAG: hypothetical protein COA79_12145 [Planctomycetota bacterium]|nr:MAG: hypothetical protein COA79_12145 [Planctomycetota bacterium]